MSPLLNFHASGLDTSAGNGLENADRLPVYEKYNSSMSALALRIRPFQTEDIGELHAIDRVCFPKHIAYSRQQLEQYLKHPKSFARLAVERERILGFVLARIDRKAGAHVLTLDITPEARRRGIGTSLMNELHAELHRRKVRVSVLEVGMDNIPAQRLYEELGYRYVGILPGYYHAGEDAYSMARFWDSEDS
jgi:ribosomal-protein-alanine N-acetyltransferase